MSLKMFHVVFILLSISLTLVFGFWAVQAERNVTSAGYFYSGIASFVIGAVLTVYFAWFLKKKL